MAYSAEKGGGPRTFPDPQACNGGEESTIVARWRRWTELGKKVGDGFVWQWRAVGRLGITEERSRTLKGSRKTLWEAQILSRGSQL